MSTIRLLDVLVLGGLLVIAVRLVPAAWKVVQIYTGIRKRRLEDATSFAPSAPSQVAALATRLTAVGFNPIGVRSTVLPGDQRRFEWNMVDQRTTTYVAMVPARTMAGGVYMVCYSAFNDGSFILTSFPQGSTVQRPDLDTTAAGATPEDTVAAHYQRLAQFAAKHGAPLPNRTMADLLVRDDTYRRRHGGATMRTRVYGFVGMTAVVTFAAGAELLRVLVLDH
jgi:hypothetical protein